MRKVPPDLEFVIAGCAMKAIIENEHQTSLNQTELPQQIILEVDEEDAFVDEMPNHNNDASNLSPTISLPWILQLLFGLNGLSLSLEGLALLYIINTRVEIPLAYLPTYGAIAFLPNSLKPLYAYFSQGRIPRYMLYTILITINGLALVATCFIPTGAVVLAFIAAFLRGVVESWAELCLGLTLIEHARAYSQLDVTCTGNTYEALASKFQAQAATSRSFGSLLANVITCLLFIERHFFSPTQTQLSGVVANTLLVSTGLFQLVGATAATFFRNDFHPNPVHTFALLQTVESNAQIVEQALDEETALREDDASQPSYSSDCQEDTQSNGDSSDQENDGVLRTMPSSTNRWYANGSLVILIQLTVLLLAMKKPIMDVTSHFVWKVLLSSLLLTTALLGMTIYSQQWWHSSHRVGLYLILRSMVPSDSMLLGSYFYWLFQSAPLQLQLLSLLGMGVSTLAAGTYSKWLSRYNSGSPFLWVIAGTTIVAAAASLGNIVIFRNSDSSHIFGIALLVKVLTTFSEELEFLPRIILATTSLGGVAKKETCRNRAPLGPREESSSSPTERENSQNVAVEYGTLISCIDFGDQLGALLTAPLVALLGISRENNFHHLDLFVLLCSFFSLLTVGLLGLIRGP